MTSLFTEPLTDDRRVLMPYSSIVSRDDDIITVVIVNEDKARIKVNVTGTEGVCIRRDRCLVLPRWLVLSKGLDKYCVPFSMTAIKLGSMSIKSGHYHVRSDSKGVLVMFDVTLSSPESEWVFAGSRILSYRMATDDYEKSTSIGYVAKNGFVPFNSVVNEDGQRLAFFRAFKTLYETPLVMQGKLHIEKFDQRCAVCASSSNSLVCSDQCAFAAGIKK